MHTVKKLPVVGGHVVRHILGAHELKARHEAHGGSLLLRQRALARENKTK